ncbi:MAG: cold shock domain-containing protein [Patescibacteria group bacterium]
MPGRETGKVKWFNDEKGFGFIEREGKPDMFVHYSGIRPRKDGGTHRSLGEGWLVTFEVRQGQKGFEAQDVARRF